MSAVGTGVFNESGINTWRVRSLVIVSDSTVLLSDGEISLDTDALPRILGSSVSYRIAVGQQQGKKGVYGRHRPLTGRTLSDAEAETPMATS